MLAYGVIYKITNLINNKIYIGQTTKVKNPNIRIKAHFVKQKGTDLVYRSSQKYGKKYFNWNIIYTAFSREELDRSEKYFISHFNSLVPFGFNIQDRKSVV